MIGHTNAPGVNDSSDFIFAGPQALCLRGCHRPRCRVTLPVAGQDRVPAIQAGDGTGNGLGALAVNRDSKQVAIDGHRPEAGFVAIGLAVAGDLDLHFRHPSR
jgi:hypothetical protein